MQSLCLISTANKQLLLIHVSITIDPEWDLQGMFTFGFASFIVFGLITDYASTVMKVRLNKMLPENERFSWWARNYSAVSNKYREFHPNSHLPDLARYSGWICIFLFVVGVLSSLFLT